MIRSGIPGVSATAAQYVQKVLMRDQSDIEATAAFTAYVSWVIYSVSCVIYIVSYGIYTISCMLLSTYPPACSCGGVRQPIFSREALPGVSST